MIRYTYSFHTYFHSLFDFNSFIYLIKSLKLLWSTPIFIYFFWFTSFKLAIAESGNNNTNLVSIWEIRPIVTNVFIIDFRLGSLEKVYKRMKILRMREIHFREIRRMLINLPFSWDLLPFDLFKYTSIYMPCYIST